MADAASRKQEEAAAAAVNNQDSAQEDARGEEAVPAAGDAPAHHDKLKGWTQGLRRAKAAATRGLSLKQMKQKKSWAPLAAFQGGSDPAVEAALGGEGFRALQQERVLEYDAGVFRLEQAALEMIAAAEPRARETGLRGLHEVAARAVRPRAHCPRSADLYLRHLPQLTPDARRPPGRRKMRQGCKCRHLTRPPNVCTCRHLTRSGSALRASSRTGKR